MVFGGGVLRRWLGHEDGALMNGMVIKETQRAPSSLLLWEDAARRQPSMSQEIGPQFSSIQLLSRVQLFATPWTTARQASLSITNSWSLLKLMSIESVMPSNQLILCSPFLLLPSIFPSIRVFSNESVLCIRWPKYWNFQGTDASVSVLPMNSQDWFPLGWTGLILQSKGFSRVFSNTTVQKHQFFGLSFLYSPTLSHIHTWLLGKA